MTEQVITYQTQFSTVNDPTYWRAVGDEMKSFVEISNYVRSLLDREMLNKKEQFIHSFRIIEKRYHTTTEEIKTFTV